MTLTLIIFIITDDVGEKKIRGSATAAIDHNVSQEELDRLSTPQRSLDRKILWMDGTMTLGRPRHKVEPHVSGKWHFLVYLIF